MRAFFGKLPYFVHERAAHLMSDAQQPHRVVLGMADELENPIVLRSTHARVASVSGAHFLAFPGLSLVRVVFFMDYPSLRPHTYNMFFGGCCLLTVYSLVCKRTRLWGNGT